MSVFVCEIQVFLHSGREDSKLFEGHEFDSWLDELIHEKWVLRLPYANFLVHNCDVTHNITLVKLCNEKCWHGKIKTINYGKTQMPIKVQTNKQTENKYNFFSFCLILLLIRSFTVIFKMRE